MMVLMLWFIDGLMAIKIVIYNEHDKMFGLVL